MHLHRTVVRALVTATVIMVGAAACSPSSSDAHPPDWQPCAENDHVQCATVTVPIDWSEPAGATLDLAVARMSATDPAHRIGTLMVLPGGPGTSGVDQLADPSPSAPTFSADIRARFDLVSLDPRGVGRSHPLRCDEGLAHTFPNLVPDTGARFADVQSYAEALAASCGAGTGELVDHLDSTSVARDIDAVREALGENTISLYGRSYGTMSGQSYAEQFPDRVRAMILDSVGDHSLSGADFMTTSARAARDTFGEFVSWCGRETVCALHGHDITEIYDRLYARAAQHELPDPNDPQVSLTPTTLSRFVVQHLYQPRWQELATALQALDTRKPQFPLAVPQPQPNGKSVAAPEFIACSDWGFDIAGQQRWEQLWREQNRNAGVLRSHFAWDAGSICAGWPTPPGNPQHRPQVSGAPSILLMNSLHDPATPYAWAVAVTEAIPGAALLTYDGWGHGVSDRNECTVTATDRYLIEGMLPRAETHCPPAERARR